MVIIKALLKHYTLFPIIAFDISIFVLAILDKSNQETIAIVILIIFITFMLWVLFCPPNNW